MGKVVTSAGLNEFVADGKVEVIPRAKPQGGAGAAEKPAETAKPTEAAAPAAEAKPAEKPPEKPAESGTEDTDLTPEELKLAGERFTRVIGQKHRRMREAQETAEEAERFAETQFNERRLAEQERDRLRAENETLKKQGKSPEEATKKKPAPEDFKAENGQIDWPAYVEAAATFAAQEATVKERERLLAEQNDAARKASEALTRERFVKAEARYPDFKETMKSADGLLIQNDVLAYLAESEKGPDLTYFLAKHPEEVKKIVQLTPRAALAYVGVLESGLEVGKPSGPASPSGEGGKGKPQPEAKGGAPAPITPLGNGSGTVPKDPSQMSFRELRDYERQRGVKRA